MENTHKLTDWYTYKSVTKRFKGPDRIPSDEEEEESLREDRSGNLYKLIKSKKVSYRTVNHGDYVDVVTKVTRQTKIVSCRLKKRTRPRPIVPDTVKGNSKMYRFSRNNKSSSQSTEPEEPRGCIYIGPLPKPKMTGSLEAFKRLKALKQCKLLASKKSE